LSLKRFILVGGVKTVSYLATAQNETDMHKS